MNLICQKQAVEQLKEAARSKCQSILLSGPSGCGKTYLAKMYSKLLDVPDFLIINSDVQSIRECIEGCYNISNKVVLCIENIDSSQLSSSYSILKFLEEPLPNVFIIVTCCNIQKVPDTIISRSIVIEMSPPTYTDIVELYSSKDEFLLQKAMKTSVWRCVKSFKDAEYVMRMSDSQINYFNGILITLNSSDCTSNIVWKLNHYEDNSEIPSSLSIQFIWETTSNYKVKKACLKCLNDLEKSRIAVHAILSRFVMECKYGY